MHANQVARSAGQDGSSAGALHELLDRHGLTREEVAPLLDGLTQAELELLDDLLVLSANAYDERHGWGARAEFLRAIKERIRQQFLSAGVTTAD